jgi:hypothetical protein
MEADIQRGGMSVVKKPGYGEHAMNLYRALCKNGGKIKIAQVQAMGIKMDAAMPVLQKRGIAEYCNRDETGSARSIRLLVILPERAMEIALMARVQP